MQRRYLKADLAELRRRRAGLVAAVLLAVLIGSLDISLGFMTVPHEYGHVWAARMVGHRVRIVQVDFLDKSASPRSASSSAQLSPGTSDATPLLQSPATAQNATSENVVTGGYGVRIVGVSGDVDIRSKRSADKNKHDE